MSLVAFCAYESPALPLSYLGEGKAGQMLLWVFGIVNVNVSKNDFNAAQLETGEWLKWWGKEVHNMCGIIWILLFVKLPAVETIHE